jgi:cell wall-associated NlpC family hydrolase
MAGATARFTPPPSGVTAGVSVEPASQVRSLPQPVSVSDIRKQLAQSGMTANSDQATLTPNGLAVAPIGAPAEVQEVIAAGNEIARLPYRYGGGHMTYEDTAYDCSGSISYVFAAAHLLDHTVVSGDLEDWGKAGPGKWITVFANGDHTFMYVAGLRFDTVALAETGTRWSTRPADEPDIKTFAVRHPVGL